MARKCLAPHSLKSYSLKTGSAMSKFKLNPWCELDSLGCELWMLKSKSVENDADENVAM